MPVFKDAYDQPVTTSSQEALDHYVEGMQCQLMGNAGGMEALQQAVALDKDFALAHTSLAAIYQGGGRIAEALAEAKTARELAPGTTRREQQHIEAITAVADGGFARALELTREHLAEFPLDALLLSRSHFMLNASGLKQRKEEAFAIYDACARYYGEDAWFLSLYAFQHNELYHFAEARRLAERSYELNTRNCWCAHSMAHVLFEAGDHPAGEGFLGGWLDGAAWQSQMAGHLNWHLALFELGLGRPDVALSLYDSAVRPSRRQGQAQQVLADPASFLWRCHIFDIEPPPDAEGEVISFANASFPRAGQTFADMHKAMLYALAGDSAAAANLASEARDLIAAGKLPAGPVVPAVIEGLSAFGSGRFEDCVALLEPYADDFVRVGGSRAQYEVLEDTLIKAYMRCGMAGKAAAKLRTRLERRPSQRDEAWLLEVTQAPPAISG